MQKVFQDNPEYLALENTREQQVLSELKIKNKGGFPWNVYETEIKNCSLKHMCQTYLYHRKKYTCYNIVDESILSYIMKM